MKYNFESYYDENDSRKEAINHPSFLIEFYEHNGFGHIVVRPVYVYENKDGMSTYSFYDHYLSECILHSFEINCQYNIGDGNPNPYAYRTGYSDKEALITENMEEARLKYKFLLKIESGLMKLRNEFGGCQTFGEHVVRVAKVMGINSFITRYVQENTSSHSGIRSISPENVRDIINGISINHKVGA